MVAKRSSNYESLALKLMHTAINNRTKNAIEKRFSNLKNVELFINVNLNDEYAKKQEEDEAKKPLKI
jgi:hypothetical protein